VHGAHLTWLCGALLGAGGFGLLVMMTTDRFMPVSQTPCRFESLDCLRQGEALAPYWEDVDLNTVDVRIRPTRFANGRTRVRRGS
jgi:hypothetical protein